MAIKGARWTIEHNCFLPLFTIYHPTHVGQYLFNRDLSQKGSPPKLKIFIQRIGGINKISKIWPLKVPVGTLNTTVICCFLLYSTRRKSVNIFSTGTYLKKGPLQN